MPEQTDTSARHRAVLDEAAAHLKKGDTSAYWKTISRISPRYGWIAGMVADNEGPLGTGARERLQDAAEDALGKRFTEAELDKVEQKIARRDLDQRALNLRTRGVAGVSLADTNRYHAAVFRDYELPPETYTLHNVAKALGPVADAVRDTDDPKDPAANARFAYAVKRHRPALGERLGNNLAMVGDGLSFISDVIEGYGHDFRGWTEERRREILDIFETDQPIRSDSKRSGTGLEKSKDADRTVIIGSLTQMDGPLGDVLLKRPEHLTAREIRQIAERRLASRDDQERAALFDLERAHYDSVYGTGPVDRDGTGKMIQMDSPAAGNEMPVPALDKDGRPLAEAVNAIAETVAGLAQNEGTGSAVSALQRGLNLLGKEPWRTPDFNPKSWDERRQAGREHTAFPLFGGPYPLKEDGLVGPKTRSALRNAVAAWGKPRVEEGLALGRFDRFARSASAGQPSGGLKSAAEKAFGPLFPQRVTLPAEPRPEGYGLQMAINDLSRNAAARDFRPLAEDGVIGPKTSEAFASTVRNTGADRFAEQLGKTMGFFSENA